MTKAMKQDERHPTVKSFDEAMEAFDKAYDNSLYNIVVQDHSIEHLDELAEATKVIASKLISDMDMILNRIKNEVAK